MRKHEEHVDVLFINPPSPNRFVYIRDINRHGRSSWERMIWPQTNLAYLAAIAEQLGLSVDIVDCIAEDIKWPAFEDILRICQPRYCLSNVISATYSNDVKALRRSKEISKAVTFGMGPHLTDSPGRSIEESEGLDFVICHEAEITLKEILELLEKDKLPSIKRLSEIRGLAFIPGRFVSGASKKPIITAQRPFVNDLDSLPRPRHDLLPLTRYWAPLLGYYTFVEASRGCSYRCIFCRQAVMWQWKYRGRRGKAIAEEALYVHSLGVDNILFHADTFTLDRNLVEELCDTLLAAGSPFRWACNTHVKSIYGKPDLVKKMKLAGCWMIAIGVESGDDQVLRNIKKQTTTEQVESVVRMIHAAGIEAWGYFVLGLPGDTPQTLEKTINFALALPLKIAKFDIGAPYPGTEFYFWAKEHNYLKARKHEDFDQNASAIVEYPNLSRDEIMAAVRRAHRRFYFRFHVLLYLLRKIFTPTTLKVFILIMRDQFLLLRGNAKYRSNIAGDR